MECCNFFLNDVFKAKKKNSRAASDFFMIFWDQCTKPIKWFSSSLMVTSLPFLMPQNYPNFLVSPIYLFNSSYISQGLQIKITSYVSRIFYVNKKIN